MSENPFPFLVGVVLRITSVFPLCWKMFSPPLDLFLWEMAVGLRFCLDLGFLIWKGVPSTHARSLRQFPSLSLLSLFFKVELGVRGGFSPLMGNGVFFFSCQTWPVVSLALMPSRNRSNFLSKRFSPPFFFLFCQSRGVFFSSFFCPDARFLPNFFDAFPFVCRRACNTYFLHFPSPPPPESGLFSPIRMSMGSSFVLFFFESPCVRPVSPFFWDFTLWLCFTRPCGLRWGRRSLAAFCLALFVL